MLTAGVFLPGAAVASQASSPAAPDSEPVEAGPGLDPGWPEVRGGDGCLGPPQLGGPEGAAARWFSLEGGVTMVEVPVRRADGNGLLHGRLTFLAGQRYATSQAPVADWLFQILAGRLASLRSESVACAASRSPSTISVMFACPPEAAADVLAGILGQLRNTDYAKDRLPALEQRPGELSRLVGELAYGGTNPLYSALDLGAEPDPGEQPVGALEMPALEVMGPEIAALVQQHHGICLGSSRLWIGIGGSEPHLALARPACQAAIRSLPAGGKLPRLAAQRAFQRVPETRVFWIESPGQPRVVVCGPKPDSPSGTGGLRARLAAENRAAEGRFEALVLGPDWSASEHWEVRVQAALPEIDAQLEMLSLWLHNLEPRVDLAPQPPVPAPSSTTLTALPSVAAHWQERFARAHAGLDPYAPALREGPDLDTAGNRAFDQFVNLSPWLVIAAGPDEAVFHEALTQLGPVTRMPRRGVRGDSPQAAFELERTFEALGGRTRWATLESFELEAQIQLPGFDEPVRSLTRQRIAPLAMRQDQILDGKQQSLIVTEEESWTVTAGRAAESDPDRHRAIVSGVRRSLPQVLQRLAVDDRLRARLSVGTVADQTIRRLEVYEARRERPILWFELGPEHLPDRAGFSGAADAGVAYTYGAYAETQGFVYPSLVIDVAHGYETTRTFRPNPELDESAFAR